MKILCLCLPGLGNTLLFTPALRVLRTMHPEAQIDVLVMYESSRQVLEGNPHVDKVLLFPFRDAGGLKSLRFLLGLRGKYDVSILGYPANRLEYNVISFLIHAKRRAGHRYLRRDRLSWLNNRCLTENDRLHDYQENIRLAGLFGYGGTPGKLDVFPDHEAARRWWTAQGLGGNVVALHTGTSLDKGAPHRRWPPERFGALARELIAAGWRVVLVDGPAETETNKIVRRGAPRVVPVHLPVRTLAGVLARCRCLVSNDSGIMHLAAAVRIPVVAIFGPTSTRYVEPLTEHRIVSRGLACQPCFVYSTKPLTCERSFECMDIPVEDVLRAVTEIVQTDIDLT